MSLTEQIYAQALVLSQDSTDVNQELLKMLCRSVDNALRRLLRDGFSPEDCRADFIAGASLMALAALSETDDMANLEQIRTGDVTLRRGSTDSAACCLRYQAEMIMRPYLKTAFSFMGV